MVKRSSWIEVILDGAVAVVFLFSFVGIFVMRFVAIPIYNLTPSVPVGLYVQWKLPISQEKLYRGEFVVFCPTSKIDAAIGSLHVQLSTDRIHGTCADHRIPFIKKVAALPGDVVDVVLGPSGFVSVNGVRWINSALQLSSSARARLGIKRSYRVRVNSGELWALGIISQSVDSRYFGPVPLTAIIGTATPVVTDAPETSAGSALSRDSLRSVGSEDS